jgi:hypothetical protein
MDIQDIDKVLKETDAKMNSHLDYIINAAEKYIAAKNDYSYIRLQIEGAKRVVADKQKKDPEYIPTEDELALIDYESSGKMNFKIMIHPDPNLPAGTGRTHVLNYGAKIVYSSKSCHQVQHIIICHEIGHILLHSKMDSKTAAHSMASKITSSEENEATYFSENILLLLKAKLISPEFQREMIACEWNLSNLINAIQPDYTISTIT